MSTSNFPLIKSKIQSSDIFHLRKELIGSLSPGYLMRSASKDDTFYTIPEKSDDILVSM